jgi:hypothetical protein
METARQLEKRRLIARRVYFLITSIFVLLSALAFTRADQEGDSPFATFWVSGRAATAGLNPYAIYPLSYQGHLERFGGTDLRAESNLNPPIMLPLFQLASHLSLLAFSYTWTVLSFLLLISCVRVLTKVNPDMQTRQLLWLMICAPTLETLGELQIYFLLLALAMVALISLRRGRPLLAALAIGLLVAIKPIFILWPVLMLFSGQTRIAVKSFVSTFVFSILPIPFYGIAIYREWFSVIVRDPHWIVPINISLIAYARRLHCPVAGIAAALVLFVVTALWVRWAKPNVLQASAVILCASVLCSPLAWVAYMLPAAPFLIMRRWGKMETIGAGLLMTPLSYVSDLAYSHNSALMALSPLPYIAGIIILMWAFSRPDLAENPHPTEELALSEAIG